MTCFFSKVLGALAVCSTERASMNIRTAHLEIPVPCCRIYGLSNCAQNLQGGSVMLDHPLFSMCFQGSDQGRAAVELPHLHKSVSMSI